MLSELGFDSLEALSDAVVPSAIREPRDGAQEKGTGEGTPYAALGQSLSESGMLQRLRALAAENQVFRSWIGQGYYNTLTPR